ncbi:MAG: 1-acyl-sn-glycerol-3-phosphate acyltransferase [Acidimicrobiia bacterium]
MAWLCRKYLEWTGWSLVGQLPPDEPKLLLIAAPHTSNWDFPIFLGVLNHLQIRLRFLAKSGLFKGPFGTFLRRIGGIPVDRSNAASIVDSAVAAFSEADEMILLLAPEGTRAAMPGWKTGFWRIAEAADVPIVFAFVDGATKTSGLGPAYRIDGDVDGFMKHAAAFYEDKNGIKPENISPVVLRH